MADTPRFPLRPSLSTCVHLSSKSRFLLTSCPGSASRESRISRRLSFRPQICESRRARLTFCKMSNRIELEANREGCAGGALF